MITASHNSYEYNGIKIFKSNGEKLGPKEEVALTKIYKSLGCFALSSKA
jgi:phosphomannomutase